jgi:hypothetical protein
MSVVLSYSDLKMDRVDSLLSADGEVLVSLPPKHAKACVAFIETVRVTRSWGKTPFRARLAPLAKGLWTTLRISLSSPRLFELSRVVVLNSSSHSWQQGSDGNVLFRFAR